MASITSHTANITRNALIAVPLYQTVLFRAVHPAPAVATRTSTDAVAFAPLETPAPTAPASHAAASASQYVLGASCVDPQPRVQKQLGYAGLGINA